MATRTSDQVARDEAGTAQADQVASEIYDRSSLKGDYTVMIAGQTVEEWERRRPLHQYCEYIDGIIYFHPPKNIPHEELEASRGVYDRSSLKGDFMVMLADQTAADFERYAPESQYCDYIDGIVYVPSPVTDRHQEQVGFLFHLLDGLRWERGGGVVLLGPAVLRLSEERKPEPDIFVRPVDGGDQPQPPALLVIEILSPSNRAHDLGLKLSTYQEAGIPEIWLFDERDRVLYVERKGDQGHQRERFSEGYVTSAAIPGFWIDVSWLWADPLPNPRRCLERILAGPPA